MNSLHQYRLYTFCLLGLLFNSNIILGQTDTIIDRYKQYLVRTLEPETDAMQSATTLTASHQWADLNYADTARAFWQNRVHMIRVRDMALAWSNPASPYYHNNNLAKAI